MMWRVSGRWLQSAGVSRYMRESGRLGRSGLGYGTNCNPKVPGNGGPEHVKYCVHYNI